MKFSDLGLSAKVTETIAEIGYTVPTPIQVAAIPEVLKGRDVLGIAQTGTGKTASYTLPLLTRLEKGRARARMPRSLVLCPTRELAAQVFENFEKYGKRHKLSVALLIGGVAFKDQERILDRGADILIATPGRLMDHFERGKLMLTRVEYFVIDEADRMLDMGFIPDIEKISKLIPFTRQTLLFSATMPKEIEQLAAKFLQNPARIEIAKSNKTANTIEQRVIYAPSGAKEKRACLREILRGLEISNAIIFSNRKKDVEIIFKSLLVHKFSVGALHGDMPQSARMEVLDKFKNNELTLLVASDVAARGLDIASVSHVINYDLPIVAEDYVHRIGRTGRAGRDGVAISMVVFNDIRQLKSIEETIETKIEWVGETPTDDDYVASAKANKRSRGNSHRGPAGFKPVSKTEPKPQSRPVAKTVVNTEANTTSKKTPTAKVANKRVDGIEIVAFGANDHIPDFLLRSCALTKIN